MTSLDLNAPKRGQMEGDTADAATSKGMVLPIVIRLESCLIDFQLDIVSRVFM
jgi:hypothetical protein